MSDPPATDGGSAPGDGAGKFGAPIARELIACGNALHMALGVWCSEAGAAEKAERIADIARSLEWQAALGAAPPTRSIAAHVAAGLRAALLPPEPPPRQEE